MEPVIGFPRPSKEEAVVFVHLSIHRPKPGKESDLIDSMHRFGQANDSPIPGLREAHTLRDRETGTLVGLAIWESEDAFRAGVPGMRAAVQSDDFDAWEDGRPEVYLLDPV
jgi:heme-degrading monooxygenase HmoA